MMTVGRRRAAFVLQVFSVKVPMAEKNEQSTSDTRITAGVLKQDPNT